MHSLFPRCPGKLARKIAHKGGGGVLSHVLFVGLSVVCIRLQHHSKQWTMIPVRVPYQIDARDNFFCCAVFVAELEY